MFRKIFSIDFTALKHKDFKLLFVGGSISMLGSMLTYVTAPLQIAQITQSYVAVGIIGLIEIGPLIVFGIWGGAIADSMNRKLVVVITEFGLGLATLILLVNSLSDEPKVVVIYAVTFIYAILDGIQRPSLGALLPQVVPTDLLTSASAVNSLRWNFGSILGPSLGGFIAATAGPAFAYGIDVVTYLIATFLFMQMSAKAAASTKERIDVKMMFSGFNYAKSRPDLLGTYAIDIIAMVLAFPNALFPFMAVEFNAPWALGLLYASMSVGALIASITSGWTSKIHHHGRAIVIAATVWGLAITFTGLAPNIYFVLLGLLVAGCSDMISGLFRMLIWNTTIPLSMRGRLGGIEMLSYSIGPQLGQIRSNFAAQVFSLRVSLISGGFICAAGSVAVGRGLRQLWSFDIRTNEYAVSERIARGEDE
ncbi:MAG: MFS transporter [Actinobacteria bacterium]|nr:MFS transporter [Actinomycetota bacterium]